ncbi:Dot/Icm T4SS effector Zinc-dependent metalloprotease LegP [Candidatus Nitrospira neomarina]|uniref:M12 family metallopeptidase n=1 Tax=Candidatus Nitrospira neomarina TaxID=3020899 RepID=A0AA96K4S1_9BACT|nr:Dot/Icm T4SS effector Zinc-dependent metalloprotease LegP [Candidatus Nitrospira neomarina]WNM63644.1 M12 family metallopeptidase [Candidatus Nitrospira neomarina]
MAKNEVLEEADVGLLAGEEVLTGYVSGNTFTNKPVQYTVVDGLAMFEGCIVLGTAEEMAAKTQAVEEGESTGIAHSVVISGDQYRWPNALVPYTIHTALPNKARVTNAIKHWTDNTNIRFVERTSSNASQYPNYVNFRVATGCWSQVGMQGGKQDIGLANGCSTGSTIHEIGHALGLWHAHSREDRDSFVTIKWANITAGKEHNFNQHITDGDDIGAYDYGSIMHYGGKAFSKNGQATIVPKQSGVILGQRSKLSKKDIAAIHSIYRTWHYNKTVSRVYTTQHAKNAHVYLSGVGYKKIDPKSNSGVTNMLSGFCEALANNRKVHVYMDGGSIYRMQLV